MDDYQKAREQLKRLISHQLIREITRDNPLEKSEVFDEMVETNSENIVSKFEKVIVSKWFEQKIVKYKSNFLLGVLQGALGSLLVFFLLAIFALVIYGSSINPFELLQK